MRKRAGRGEPTGEQFGGVKIIKRVKWEKKLKECETGGKACRYCGKRRKSRLGARKTEKIQDSVPGGAVRRRPPSSKRSETCDIYLRLVQVGRGPFARGERNPPALV